MNRPARRKPVLDQSLRPHWVFAIALGSAVGWGAFVLPHDWITKGGWGGTLIGFVIGGSLIAVIAANYGTLIRALPVTGGGVAFAFAALGRVHSFVAGWCLTLAYAGCVALNASVLSLVARRVAPDLMQAMPLYTVAGWQVHLPDVVISAAALVLFAWVNARGVEFTGRLQYLAVVLMLAAVALILTATCVQWARGQASLPPAFPAHVAPLAGIATIVSFAPWAYVGFDTVPQTAGEFNFSPRRAMALLLWGVVAATLIYMAMTFATALTIEGAPTTGDATWATAHAIAGTIGRSGTALMIVAVTMGVLTGLNGFFVAASRVLMTMGRAHMLPDVFAKVHPTRRTPVVGILFTLLVCLATPWFGRAALLWVVDMTSAGIAVAYFYTSYCAWRIGRTGHVRGMKEDLAPSRLNQVLGVLGCLFAVGFLALLLVPGSPGQLGWQSMVVLLVWLVGGFVFYLTRRSALHATDEADLQRIILG